MYIAGMEIGLGIIAALLLIRVFDAIIGAALSASHDRMAQQGPIQRKTVIAWLISCAVIFGVPVALGLLAH